MESFNVVQSKSGYQRLPSQEAGAKDPEATTAPAQQAVTQGQAYALFSPSNDRDFDSHWCSPWGDCNGAGWAACCLTIWCPWVARGWTLKRASGNTYLAIGVPLLFPAALLIYILLSALGGPSIVWSILYWLTTLSIGVWSRRYIRRTLSLDSAKHDPTGTLCCDIWSQCHGLGLCQETRTMIMNRVEDGVWRGPGRMTVSLMSVHPAPPQTAPPV